MKEVEQIELIKAQLDDASIIKIRSQIPMLQATSNGKPLIYLNNAATALKPRCVIDKMSEYYQSYGVNIARGVDAVGYMATKTFEETRKKVAEFIGAKIENSIIFTRGTTAGINLVCRSFAENIVQESDEIVVSDGEHHANYLPWQQLALRKKAKLVLVKVNEDGIVTKEALEQVLTDKTKIVSLFHISNVMGAVNDIQTLAAVAHQKGAYFCCDGAQGIVHETVDVSLTDVDFYAFSGHKLYGPTGVGVLYGKYELLSNMQPYEYGGEMIDIVDVYQSTFADPPHRFEAGTMPIAEVIGLGEAIHYVSAIGFSYIKKRTSMLTKYALDQLSKLDTVELYNKNNVSAGVVSYNMIGIHPHDAAGIYDREGVSLRAGQHCSQPMMRALNQHATLRASITFYNTIEEIDQFIEVTKQAGDFLDVLF